MDQIRLVASSSENDPSKFNVVLNEPLDLSGGKWRLALLELVIPNELSLLEIEKDKILIVKKNNLPPSARGDGRARHRRSVSATPPPLSPINMANYFVWVEPYISSPRTSVSDMHSFLIQIFTRPWPEGHAFFGENRAKIYADALGKFFFKVKLQQIRGRHGIASQTLWSSELAKSHLKNVFGFKKKDGITEGQYLAFERELTGIPWYVACTRVTGKQHGTWEMVYNAIFDDNLTRFATASGKNFIEDFLVMIDPHITSFHRQVLAARKVTDENTGENRGITSRDTTDPVIVTVSLPVETEETSTTEGYSVLPDGISASSDGQPDATLSVVTLPGTKGEEETSTTGGYSVLSGEISAPTGDASDPSLGGTDQNEPSVGTEGGLFVRTLSSEGDHATEESGGYRIISSDDKENDSNTNGGTPTGRNIADIPSEENTSDDEENESNTDEGTTNGGTPTGRNIADIPSEENVDHDSEKKTNGGTSVDVERNIPNDTDQEGAVNNNEGRINSGTTNDENIVTDDGTTDPTKLGEVFKVSDIKFESGNIHGAKEFINYINSKLEKMGVGTFVRYNQENKKATFVVAREEHIVLKGKLPLIFSLPNFMQGPKRFKSLYCVDPWLDSRMLVVYSDITKPISFGESEHPVVQIIPLVINSKKNSLHYVFDNPIYLELNTNYVTGFNMSVHNEIGQPIKLNTSTKITMKLVITKV